MAVGLLLYLQKYGAGRTGASVRSSAAQLFKRWCHTCSGRGLPLTYPFGVTSMTLGGSAVSTIEASVVLRSNAGQYRDRARSTIDPLQLRFLMQEVITHLAEGCCHNGSRVVSRQADL